MNSNKVSFLYKEIQGWEVMCKHFSETAVDKRWNYNCHVGACAYT